MRSLPALKRVSVERVRDEWIRILSLPDAVAQLGYASQLGVLAQILPELACRRRACDRGMDLLAAVERLGWEDGCWDVARDGAVDSVLLTHRSRLQDHWREALSASCSRWLALKLAALLSHLPEAPAVAADMLRRYHLSNVCIAHVHNVLSAYGVLQALPGRQELSEVWVYRYYRRAGSAGVDGAVLSLLAAGEAEGVASPAQRVAWADFLLRCWYDARSDVVDPPQLLSGRDLVRELRLCPGPLIGELLEAVREAQVRGCVVSRTQALAYVRRLAEGDSSCQRNGR